MSKRPEIRHERNRDNFNKGRLAKYLPNLCRDYLFKVPFLLVDHRRP